MQLSRSRGRRKAVRLATFNIKHAQLRGLPPLVDLLRQARPDLAGLQEVDVGCSRSGDADQPAGLGTALGMASCFAPALPLEGGSYGNALLAVPELLRGEPLQAAAVPLPGGRSTAGPHRSRAPRPRPAACPLRASAVDRRERPRASGGGAVIRFVLHRPRSSQNIGAAARALANTGAGALWTVEPIGFDRSQAAKLAAGADEVLEGMRVVRTLDEALEGCVDVVMTTGRPVPGALDPRATARRLLDSAGEVALV